MKIDRALKLHLPWADELVRGKFPILIRRINTNIRGELGVVASQGFDKYAFERGYNPEIYEELYGYLIGTIELEKVDKVGQLRIIKRLISDVNGEFAKWYPKNFIPLDNDVYFWYIKNPKKFTNPFKLDRKSGYVWLKLNDNEKTAIKKWK